MNVPGVVLAVHDALDDAGIAHAFGGAIALAYAVGEPRGTIDVDVNVFMPAGRAAFEALPAGVTWTAGHVEQAVRAGQIRVWWEEVPLDLFFDYHRFHEHAAGTVQVVPFADRRIPILGADELAVLKAFFNRTRDWADLEAMVEAGSFDVGAVRRWLVDLLGADDPRVERLDSISSGGSG